MVHMQRLVDPAREEVNRSDMVNVIGPIDQETAPDHEKEQGEVDPVKPPDRDRVLELEFLHRGSSGTQFGSRNFVSYLKGYPYLFRYAAIGHNKSVTTI